MAAVRVLSALLVLVIGGQAVLADNDVYKNHASALQFLDEISENGADQNRRLDWAVSMMGLGAIVKADSDITTLANSLKKAVDADIISKKDAEHMVVDSSNEKKFYLGVNGSPREVLKEAIKIASEAENVPQKKLDKLKEWLANLDDKRPSAEEPRNVAYEFKDKADNFVFLNRGLNEQKLAGYEVATMLFVAGQKYANGRQESIVTTVVDAFDRATRQKVISRDLAYTLLRVLVADDGLLRKANVNRADAVKELVKSALRGQKISKAEAKKLKEWAGKSKKSNSSSSSSSEEN